MIPKEELTNLAKNVVSEANHSFLTKEDIIENFKDNGFLVNKNTMIGYTSYMEYNKETKRGSISYSVEEKDKRQKEILLLNYSTFVFNNDKDIKLYYKDIPNKRVMKVFSSLLVRESSIKEFPEEDIKQGGVKNENNK